MVMKGNSCHRCGLILYAGEKICPHCGSRVRFPERHWFILFLSLFALFYLLLTVG